MNGVSIEPGAVHTRGQLTHLTTANVLACGRGESGILVQSEDLAGLRSSETPHAWEDEMGTWLALLVGALSGGAITLAVAKGILGQIGVAAFKGASGVAARIYRKHADARHATREARNPLVVKMTRALSQPGLYELLADLYSRHPILSRADWTYPAAVFVLDEPQPLDRDRPRLLVQSPQWRQYDDYHAPVRWGGDRYRQRLIKQGSKIVNNDTYTMELIVPDPTDPRIVCNVGQYNWYINTCGALDWELLSLFSRARSGRLRTGEDLLAELPLRRQLHETVGDPVLIGRGRSAPLHVSTMIVFPHKGRRLVWMRKRKVSGVALNPGQLAVVPSGMVQPELHYYEEELDIWHTVMREYLEELFDVRAPKNAKYDWFYHDPHVLDMRELLRTGQAKLWVTGVTVNLCSLLPEVCTLLVVYTDDWYDSSAFAFNEEYDDKGRKWLPLSNDDGDMLLLLQPAKVVPGCASAFWLGVDALRLIEGTQEHRL